MARFLGSKAHTMVILIPHFLAFASFGILLGGVAAMQQACGGAVRNNLLGVDAYLAQVPCGRFFSFDWWITFWQGAIWVILLYFIATRQVHRARNALTGLLINATLLLMALTNTWYHAWSGLGATQTNAEFNNRAKAAFTGGLVGAIADILLIMTMGLHDERTEKKREQFQTSHVHATTGVGVPATEAETVGYRPGPIEGRAE